MTYELVPAFHPEQGLVLPLNYQGTDYDVWFGYEDLLQLWDLPRPVKHFRLYWEQRNALVQKGWLTEHESPHPNYYDEPFIATSLFRSEWPFIRRLWNFNLMIKRPARRVIRPDKTEVTRAKDLPCPFCAERARLNVEYNVQPPWGPCHLHTKDAT